MSADENLPPRKKVKHYDNGEPHFLTFSCYRRLPLLSKDRTRTWFIEALERARIKHGFHLWAWVIMPEHVHLLLWPPADKISPDPNSTQGRIRGILASIKQPVAEKAIQYLQEHSPEFLSRLRVHNRDRSYHRFWQAGSGYDQNVSEARALHELTEYIHLNPVRRGLVNRPEDWIWSSARDWNRLSGQLIKVDRTLPDTIGIPWLIRNSDRN